MTFFIPIGDSSAEG